MISTTLLDTQDVAEHLLNPIVPSSKTPSEKNPIPEKRRVNPILMRDAETIEREVSHLNTITGEFKDFSVEISGDSIVEKSGDYVVGGTAHDQ